MRKTAGEKFQVEQMYKENKIVDKKKIEQTVEK